MTWETVVLLAANSVGWIIAGRIAYGCWAWERRKTWYATRATIEWECVE